MSDEAREAQAGKAAVDENQKLAESEEQITKPAPKGKPQREKRSQESRRWEKACRKKTDKQKQLSIVK